MCDRRYCERKKTHAMLKSNIKPWNNLYHRDLVSERYTFETQDVNTGRSVNVCKKKYYWLLIFHISVVHCIRTKLTLVQKSGLHRLMSHLMIQKKTGLNIDN